MATTIDMVDFRTIEAEIRPLVARCPWKAMERALRNAGAKLCEQALVWTFDAAAIPLVAGTPQYAIPTQGQGMTWRVISVQYQAPDADAQSRRPLYPRTEIEMEGQRVQGNDYRNHFSWFGGPSDWRTWQSSPRYYLHHDTSEQIRMVGVPTSDDAGAYIYLHIAQTLAQDATQMPGWIVRRYRRTLAKGAMADLFMQPDEAWTDERRGVTLAEEFQNLVDDATAHQLRSHTTGSYTIQPRHSLDA